MKRLHLMLLVSALFSTSGCLKEGSFGEGTGEDPGSALPDSADYADFRRDTTDFLAQLGGQGFAGTLLVARGDTLIVDTGVGMADRSANRPWTTETVSDIGSITKQFTGAAILALQEDGLLKVEDPIGKYFSPVPGDKAAITLHHLLTHSSGLTDPPVGDWDPVGRDEYVRMALVQTLQFDPGSSYAYSNAGYSLLGAVIEKVSGKSYESYLRDRLFQPSGMTGTGYQLAEWDTSDIAAGYRGVERWGTTLERPMADDGPYWALRGNGGIHSTVGDMWRWARALLDGTALNPASMQAYWAPHVDEGYGDSFYGYGWVIIEGEGYRLVTHNGGNDIFFADMAIYPDLQIVMVLLTNVASDWPNSDRLLEYISLRMLKGERYPGISALK